MRGVEPGFGPATVVPADDPPTTGDTTAPGDGGGVWWTRYRDAISGRLSKAALTVLEADARYIAGKALPRIGSALDVGAWPESRVRTGMVVGSVQSGKTASMLAVAAMALDAGVDLLILLAGTRVGLWLQTYERLLAQLDGSTVDNAYRRRHTRLILPQPSDVLNDQRAEPARYLQRPLARQALRSGIPIICVVPKEDDHLLMVRRFLSDVVTGEFLGKRERLYSILLLDDEADDASILDSQRSQKVTPRFITALWSGDQEASTTRHERMYATYVAYTATPQANILQATHNPLSPRDFAAALRTPGVAGNVLPRSLTYAEPAGIASYYCGGEMFYERLRHAGDGSLCVSVPFPELRPVETQADLLARREAQRWAMLSDALRCFLVGAAIRSLAPGWEHAFDRQHLFGTEPEARRTSALAHTMLIHPSARKEDHFTTAVDIIRWAHAEPGLEGETEVSTEIDEAPGLFAAALATRMAKEESAWSVWLQRFEASRIALSTQPRAPFTPITATDWPKVKAALLERVFPNVRLRVLNSDPASDDRPCFEPIGEDSGFRVAPDCLSIFVAGNVLSRGLTLEGLATSLFLRAATEPAADTQMQMQRWFGYRGGHLPFCRVFLYEDQLDLFRRYHVNDNTLKTEVMASMDGASQPSRSGLVLEGAAFVATSKVDARKVPLSPGPRPSVRLINSSDNKSANHNLGVAADLLDDGEWRPLVDDRGLERGVIRSEPVTLVRLAEILESLRYSHHDPDLRAELSQRWIHYARLLSIREPLFKPPMRTPGTYDIEPQSCPYSIAAYFRLWSSLTDNRTAPGFYPTDWPDIPWNYAEAPRTSPPEFYVAFRYGEHRARDPRLAIRGVRAVARQAHSNGRSLQTLWGTRGYGGSYYGDEFVDYYHHQTRPVPSIQGGATWRPRGHPGLALFHVVNIPDVPIDQLAIGLGIPHGGPDHIAALRP
ncbi:Z1 domain-containing protein [Rubrivivax albus]|uniref:Putative endonuclease Z1 domain-containing protein n=1 Tax=Rubrivivax albus TaxID=2499835 RepID=A0A3S2U7N7_9BURK|nr:Z1 domain-containing protein [Rubrivivax albus]RVT50353.1 hypothetical protein ENE75_15145 [Rubrivivax albus]